LDRRIKLVYVFSIVIVSVLVLRLIQVQIIRHSIYKEKAKSQWLKRTVLHAQRGGIYDRNNVPFVVSCISYDVGVTPGDFPSKDQHKLRLLSRITGVSIKELRKKLARNCPYIPLARDLNLAEDEVAALSSLPGVRLDPKNDRLYLRNAVPRQLIGRINFKGEGVSGIEYAFNKDLSGVDGWVIKYRDALMHTFRRFDSPCRKPKNGRNLVLTLDSQIQEIVDYELREGVRKYKARFGVAIVVDPNTGEILALSERTADECGRKIGIKHSALFSTSCIYEPGSTFKLITDSFLLEKGVVDPEDSFFGENGKVRFEFGVFHDDHKYGWLTFKKSFVYSSNICTIKAVNGTSPIEFYRYILSFGFGSRSGIMLPAESRGRLSHPEHWSRRSLPSIAIGHEIGVTPIQMVMAYCTLANGGELYRPMIVKELRDEYGSVLKRFNPEKLRRVFSRSTAETMKEFCREVVLEGTGKKANVVGVSVAGKTGTSQKSDRNGYLTGKYVASFIGFTPVDNPKIVCLVMLDEPPFPYNFGGESAAPIFRKIIEGIYQSTDILSEPQIEVAVGKVKYSYVQVPFLLGMDISSAERVISSLGLSFHYEGESGVIYSQSPDPGALVRKDSRVVVRLRDDKGRPGVVRVPDVRFLSSRMARRLIIGSGLKCRIKGSGLVRKQTPVAGRSVKTGAIVTLWCSSAGLTGAGSGVIDIAGE